MFMGNMIQIQEIKKNRIKDYLWKIKFDFLRNNKYKDLLQVLWTMSKSNHMKGYEHHSQALRKHT